MKAIDKAWEENLKKSKNNQWKSKEEIIETLCPYDYRLKNNPNCNDGEGNEICVKCWNREIEEYMQEENNINESELTFDKLKESPINEMYFSYMTENNFIKSLKNDEYIINCEDGTLTYDDIPKTIKWLQNVYDCCTELKNKVEYVDFNTAKKHMSNNGMAECEGVLYDSSSKFSLEVTNSNNWVLL